MGEGADPVDGVGDVNRIRIDRGSEQADRITEHAGKVRLLIAPCQQ